MFKRYIGYSLFVFVVLFMMINCGKNEQKNKNGSLSLNAEQNLPTLLDFGAHNCIPCKKMMPVLEELKEEFKGKMNVQFIDVWKPENKQQALSYGIRRIPTQIFLDPSGNELWRHEGFISKEDILKKWKELGIDFLK